MPDLTNMYEDGTDIEARIEQAGFQLKMAADAKGIDLNSFNNDELSSMIADMVIDDDSGQQQQQGEGEGEQGEYGDQQQYEGGDEGGEYGEEGKTAELTYSDVSHEVTKRAAAEGIDLSQVDGDVYDEIFQKVAMEMSDPGYAEETQKLAAQEGYMDYLGRVAARSFCDEINKLAAEEEDEDDDEDKKEKKAAIKEHAKAFLSKVRGGEARASERIGRALRSAKSQTGDGAAVARKNRIVGRSAVGGGAAAAGAGGAYARHRSKKAELEEVALAIDVLRAAGYPL